MTIFGVMLLAVCTLVGAFLGDQLGVLLHVKNNVGGVGIAMMLLICARAWLTRQGKVMAEPFRLGVEFWAALYIPIVVAMAATQNVVAAVEGGPIVVIAAVVSVVLCFACVALISRMGGDPPLEPLETAKDDHALRVISGDPE